jgi:phage terminase large subunit
LSKWQQRSSFLKEQFTWNKERIYNNDFKETWFLSARSYPKDADAEALGRSLSGLHSPYAFILLDESGDMPASLQKKAEQIFTGGTVDALIMTAGNPTSTSGLLYDVATKGADVWDVITITADPDDPKRTPRVDIDHAREIIQRYGKDDPWVMATILGEFPPGGSAQLIPLELVEKAMNRKIHQHDFEYSQKRLGIDVARGGMDKTIMFPRQGLQAFNFKELAKDRSNVQAAQVLASKMKWGSECEFVDGTGGFGSGLIDSMVQAGHTPFEVHFSGKADKSVYANKRSEMWFRMKEWLERGGSLPDNQTLKKELTAPKYFFKKGKFALEEKDQIIKRLKFSPDRADALALTFTIDEMPTMAGELGTLNRIQAGQTIVNDYDPMDSIKDQYNPFK